MPITKNPLPWLKLMAQVAYPIRIMPGADPNFISIHYQEASKARLKIYAGQFQETPEPPKMTDEHRAAYCGFASVTEMRRALGED